MLTLKYILLFCFCTRLMVKYGFSGGSIANVSYQETEFLDGATGLWIVGPVLPEVNTRHLLISMSETTVLYIGGRSSTHL